MKLKCPKKTCGYTWNYYGNAERYTGCPKCHTSMSIERARRRAKGQPMSKPPRALKLRRKGDDND